MEKTQKQASLSSSARWVIENKRKFTELVQHLKDLIDDLEGLTRFLDVTDRQREMIQIELESVSEIPTLEAIEEARVGTIEAVSNATSLRLWKLRERYLVNSEKGDITNRNNLYQDTMELSEKEWDILCQNGEIEQCEYDRYRRQVSGFT